MSQSPTPNRSSRRPTALVATCLTAFGTGATVAAIVPPPPSVAKPTSAIEPRALEALRYMGGYLRSLNRFSVDAQTMRDEVLPDGEKVTIGGTVNYLARVPDRLRADVRTDRKQRQLLYDGKTLTVYAPRMHFYASTPAPSTIGATLDSARTRYGIEMPLADLFLWGTSRDGVDELTSARYIGPAFVDGIDTDQYAYRQGGSDWQLWVQRGNTPLPRKLVITTTDETARPQYVANLKWNLTPAVNDAMFTFTPPRDASRIVFAPNTGAVNAAPK